MNSYAIENKQTEELRRVSERLQLATKAAGIGIWDWDVVNDELVWDDTMYELFGIRKEDFSGAYDAWAKSLAPEDFERASAEVQAALRGEREFSVEFRIVRPDRSIHFIKAFAETLWDEEGRPVRMVGVNYDITERKLAEEQITLLQSITMDVAAAQDLESALGVVLRRVCEKTGWALGQAWVPRQDGTGIDCCPVWFATASGFEEFRTLSRDVVLTPGEGLPGRVMTSGQPVWIRDVTQDANFPRAEAARENGLKAALGVPILSGSEVTAILEFFLVEPREEDERLVSVITAVAAQIGLVFEHKSAEQRLRWSEERLRLLLDSTAEGIFGVDLLGKCTFCNAACLRLLAYERPEELLGRNMHLLIGHSRADGTPYSLSECPVIESLQSAASAFSDDDVFWRKDGISFPAAYWSHPMFREGSHIGAVVTFLDITERKLAEAALRASEERYRTIVEAAPEAIVVVDVATGKFVDFNPQALALFKLTADEILKIGPVEMSPDYQPDKRASSAEAIRYIRRALSGETPIFEWTHCDSSGIEIPCEVRLLQLPDQSRQLVRGTITDITERKQAEDQLLSSRQQLRALSERLRRAKEDEGIRIARELHDELGSTLTSLKWSLFGLKEFDFGPRTANATEKIGEMVGLVDTTINTVRRISTELRPGVLDDLGLVAAIEWHTQQFQANTGIHCKCEALADHVDLDREQATVIFRIVQEAMTNVLRHSRATRVDVIIEEEDGELVVEIRDNGRGITESEKIGTRTLGLLGMRERARSIDGTIDITGIKEKGTKLIVRIPLQRQVELQ